MPRIIYIEKAFAVPAGGSLADFIFKRSGEKAVYLHYLKIITNANTSSVVIYIDGYKFAPSLGASTSFELGKPILFDKISINDSIGISITASSAGSTTVFIYAYLEVTTE
jgi:hypothetical protein